MTRERHTVNSSIAKNFITSLCFLFCLVWVNTVTAAGFSFAIIADPHIDGNPEHTTQFEAAVNWIIENKTETGIELVFIVGDIGWFRTGKKHNLEIAADILDNLKNSGIEYVPVIGDDEIQAGEERKFERVFDSHFEHLEETLDNFTPLIKHTDDSIYYNYSFDYKDCHFICADFVARTGNGECGNLNDFPGGVWEWFKRDIVNCSKQKKENIVVISHIGLFRTGVSFADKYLFDKRDMKKVKDFTAGYADYIACNYAGHIHQNWHHRVSTGFLNSLYDVWVTDETWSDKRFLEITDGEGTVRWVKVSLDDGTVQYTQHIN